MKTVDSGCDYEEVNGVTSENRTKLSWKNLLRQLLVCSTMWTMFFMFGVQLGAPTVIISQLQKEKNSTTVIDDTLASWLTSMFTIGSIPWTCVLPLIVHSIGRKKTYIFVCFTTFIGALIIYLSKTITHILVGEFIFGILLGSTISISPFIISEYSSPQYRGLYLTIKSASALWGVLVANIIGTFWYWKNIYLLVFICNAYTMMVFFWPESPYWLAKERRFSDCAKSYKKLMGISQNTKKDLDLLIQSYEFIEDKDNENGKKSSKNFNTITKLLRSKTFYRPLLLAMLVSMQFHFMGKLICIMYIIQILKKITQDEAMAYKGMLILDGVTVFSAYCGCVLSRYCKRRSLLFTTSFLTVIFLYMISLYLFLIYKSVIIENNMITISLLSFFSVTVSSGPMILLSSIYGEIISFKHQRSSAIIYGIFCSVLMSLSLKTSLFIFKQLTLPGAFLFFAVISTIVTLTLYLYLPETKNKSCHEIENYFKGFSEKIIKTMSVDK